MKSCRKVIWIMEKTEWECVGHLVNVLFQFAFSFGSQGWVLETWSACRNLKNLELFVLSPLVSCFSFSSNLASLLMHSWCCNSAKHYFCSRCLWLALALSMSAAPNPWILFLNFDFSITFEVPGELVLDLESVLAQVNLVAALQLVVVATIVVLVMQGLNHLLGPKCHPSLLLLVVVLVVSSETSALSCTLFFFWIYNLGLF